MSGRREYVRVYLDIRSDQRFATIYGDDTHLATWLRLLMEADALWPAPAAIPRSVEQASLDALVLAGLVEMLPHDQYRIHGMDAERQARSEQGTMANTIRWGRVRADADPNPDRTPSRTPVTSPHQNPAGLHAEPSRAEPSRAEQSRAEQTRAGTDDDGRDDLEAFLMLRRRAPTPKQRRLLDEVMDRHDLTGPAWAADIMYRNPDDPIGAVIEADKAWRAERIEAAQAAEAPKPQARRPRGLPQTTRDIMAEMAVLKSLEHSEDRGVFEAIDGLDKATRPKFADAAAPSRNTVDNNPDYRAIREAIIARDAERNGAA